MPHETSMPPNIIDTPQLYDGSVTIDKLDPTLTTDLLAALLTVSQGTIYYAGYTAGNGTQNIGTPIPYGAIITGAVIEQLDDWDGSPTINIGTGTDADCYIPNASISKSKSAVTGDDPASLGVALWVPGAYTGGSLSAGSQTKTPVVIGAGTQTVTVGPPADFTVTAWPAVTTPDNWTVTQGTLTPAAISTWGHPRTTYVGKTYDAQPIATVTGTNATKGAALVTIYYIQSIMEVQPP